jgi:hypothetical protein
MTRRVTYEVDRWWMVAAMLPMFDLPPATPAEMEKLAVDDFFEDLYEALCDRIPLEQERQKWLKEAGEPYIPQAIVAVLTSLTADELDMFMSECADRALAVLQGTPIDREGLNTSLLPMIVGYLEDKL